VVAYLLLSSRSMACCIEWMDYRMIMVMMMVIMVIVVLTLITLMLLVLCML
jgi:hypothetical protein